MKTEDYNPSKFYLNTQEAAKILGMGPQTLMNWRSQRRGPAYVIMGNRSIRYRQEDLEKYANARLVTVEA